MDQFIATRLQVGFLRNQCLIPSVGSDVSLFRSAQTGPPSILYNELFPWRLSSWGMKLTTHLPLAPSCTFTPTYVFMAWCLLKHWDNFTLFYKSLDRIITLYILIFFFSGKKIRQWQFISLSEQASSDSENVSWHISLYCFYILTAVRLMVTVH
jgi:hypothetical protein